MALYVQYGCGLSAPDGWVNFDVSPTLRLQKAPVIGRFFKKKVLFPSSIRYGDILYHLPGIKKESCAGIYCSHVLEHLALKDLKIALRNTYDLLKPGGIFRCVLPDLETTVNMYVEKKKQGDKQASIWFLRETLLGIEQRPRGIKQLLISFYGNSHHLWMWDHDSLKVELEAAGFRQVRKCTFNDSIDSHFKLVESKDRFYNAMALEAIK